MGLDEVEAFPKRVWQDGFHFRGDEADVEHVADMGHVFEAVAGELHLKEVPDGYDAYFAEAVGLADFRDGGEIVRANLFTSEDKMDGTFGFANLRVDEHVDSGGVAVFEAVVGGALFEFVEVGAPNGDIDVIGEPRIFFAYGAYMEEYRHASDELIGNTGFVHELAEAIDDAKKFFHFFVE